MFLQISVRRPGRRNDESNPRHAAVGNGEHRNTADREANGDALTHAQFFAQNKDANNDGEYGCNEIAECNFQNVFVDNRPHICCPVDGEQHACKANAGNKASVAKYLEQREKTPSGQHGCNENDGGGDDAPTNEFERVKFLECFPIQRE